MGRRFYLKVALPCTAAPSGELLVEPGSSEPGRGRQDARHPGEPPATSPTALSFRAIPRLTRRKCRPADLVCSGPDGPKRSGGSIHHVDVAVPAAPEPERHFERGGRSGPLVGPAPARSRPGLHGRAVG